MSPTKANSPARDNWTKKLRLWLGRNPSMKSLPSLQNGTTPEKDDEAPTYAPPPYADVASTIGSGPEAAILSIARAIEAFALASNASARKALFYKHVPKVTQARNAAVAAKATSDAIIGIVMCIRSLPATMKGMTDVVAMWIRLVMHYNTRAVEGLAAGLDPLKSTAICTVECETRFLQERKQFSREIRSAFPKNTERWLCSQIRGVFFTVPFPAIVDILPALNDAVTKVATDLVATCKDARASAIEDYKTFATDSANRFEETANKLLKRR